MGTIKVGIREAKITLSKLIKQVRQGQNIIITDRGRPVAKIVDLPSESLDAKERIILLEQQGWIEPAKKEFPDNSPLPLPISDELAQKYLQQSRES